MLSSLIVAIGLVLGAPFVAGVAGEVADGQIETPANQQQSPPSASETSYDRFAGVIELATGSLHTCALDGSGGVWCWGNNQFGQLGDGTTTSSVRPVRVSGLSNYAYAISASNYHTCALTRYDGVKCWGNNQSGQLGDGTTTHRNKPVVVNGLTGDMTAIAAGDNHTCVLTKYDGVWCWGSNQWGQLGDGTGIPRYTPVKVVGLIGNTSSDVSGVTAGGDSVWDLLEMGGLFLITAGSDFTCAAFGWGEVKCWGDNHYGQLGDGTTTKRLTPVYVTGLKNYVNAIDAGGAHVCVQLLTGGAQCWGRNQYGQLGDGTMIDRHTPVDVTEFGFSKIGISAGGGHTCGLTDTGAVKCWGGNGWGKLGDSTTTDRPQPVYVYGMNGLDYEKVAVSVSAGWQHTCARVTNSRAMCWGDNQFGQLGSYTGVTFYTRPDFVSTPQVTSKLFLPGLYR